MYSLECPFCFRSFLLKKRKVASLVECPSCEKFSLFLHSYFLQDTYFLCPDIEYAINRELYDIIELFKTKDGLIPSAAEVLCYSKKWKSAYFVSHLDIGRIENIIAAYWNSSFVFKMEFEK